MSFDYNIYYQGCFVVPTLIILIILIILIAASIKILLYIIKRQKLPAITGVKACSLILLCFILEYFCWLHIGFLANGGIYLMSEKESDAVVISGIIENIETIPLSIWNNQMNKLKSDYQTNVDEAGVIFTINGVRCRAIAKGLFEIGDNVEVTYLPKSAYVLKLVSTS